MGKPIIAQKRGKALGGTYTANSHNFKGEAKHAENGQAIVLDIIHCAGHTAPLLLVENELGMMYLNIAGQGAAVGDVIDIGENAELKIGNTLMLQDIPAGTPIFNIEAQPGNGGSFVRSSGTTARVVSSTEKHVTVRLPSKKLKTFNGKCRATIGVVAGGGRTDKPLLKAGTAFHKHKARNKYWPIVSGTSMNAADHPFGNTRSLRKAKAKPAGRNAPPGRKVGMIAPKRTGRK